MQPRARIGATPVGRLELGKSAFSELQMSSVTVMTVITQVDGLTFMRLLVARSVCTGFPSISLSVPSADSEPVIDVSVTGSKRASNGLRGYVETPRKETSDWRFVDDHLVSFGHMI